MSPRKIPGAKRNKRLAPRRRRLAVSSVAIVGPGRVGQALGKLLARVGFRVLFVAGRRLAAARQAVRFIGSGRAIRLATPELTRAQVILLTTTDAALSQVVRELASWAFSHGDWSGKVVLHTCGALPAAVLEPLRRRGAAIGSLHPFQTIPTREAGVRNLVGCYWGIEGDTAARKIATKWVRALGGIPFAVRPSGKTLYHAAAFLVCPTVVALMERASHLLHQAGVPVRIARPLLGRFVGETLRNFVELGPRRALSGPAVRGDWVTIERHLRALRRFSPHTVPVYVSLLRAILRLAGRRTPRALKSWLKG